MVRRRQVLLSNGKRSRIIVAAMRFSIRVGASRRKPETPGLQERGGRRADKRRAVPECRAPSLSAAASRRTVLAAFWCAAPARPHDPRTAFAYPGQSDRGRSASSSRTDRSVRRAGFRGPPVSACEADSRRRTLLRHQERLRTAPLTEQDTRTIMLIRNIVKATSRRKKHDRSPHGSKRNAGQFPDFAALHPGYELRPHVRTAHPSLRGAKRRSNPTRASRQRWIASSRIALLAMTAADSGAAP